MALIHLTEASASAPRLSGTNGDLCLVLDWALVQNGWTIDYTSGNKRCYRAGTGNRFILYVEHDSATSGNAGLAVIRGAESQVAGVLTDTFPLASQVANASANWLVSNAASTAARNFDLYIGTTFVIFCVNYAGTANVWEVHFFGDIPPSLSGDSYNTVCFTRNSTNVSTSQWIAGSISTFTGSSRWYWTRSYDGTVKSSAGGPITWTSGAWGSASNLPLPLAGPSLSVDSRVVTMLDAGNTTAGAGVAGVGLPIRGWLPNIREPLHSNSGTTLQTRTTYTDTAFNASSSFNPVRSGNTSTGFTIIEEDNFWTVPG